MGCRNSKPGRVDEEASVPCHPVPFGHLSYTPALPAAMGPLWDFPIEWWYYVGWAVGSTDDQNSKEMKFTILLETFRLSQDRDSTLACALYGIGHVPVSKEQHQLKEDQSKEEQYITHWTPGSGEFPTPSSTAWSMAFKNELLEQVTMNCELVIGTLGLRNATYKVTMNDTTNDVSVSLLLRDTFGMVFEGASGAYPKNPQDEYSLEFAMPSLVIEEGSSITMKGETVSLSKGRLWLDRQTLRKSRFFGKDFSASQPDQSEPDNKSLYIGNWLAVTIDQTQYMIAFFWDQQTPQWKVGRKLDPPVNPNCTIGLEYLPLTAWDGKSPFQGINVLKSDEFDLNILNPDDPDNSPHWVSPTSHNTYCSAWQLRIREKVYIVRVLIPSSEITLYNESFFEGAATVHEESSGEEVGNAFVEQMGYN